MLEGQTISANRLPRRRFQPFSEPRQGQLLGGDIQPTDRSWRSAGPPYVEETGRSRPGVPIVFVSHEADQLKQEGAPSPSWSFLTVVGEGGLGPPAPVLLARLLGQRLVEVITIPPDRPSPSERPRTLERMLLARRDLGLQLSPEYAFRTVQIALRLGAFEMARRLSKEGAERFPGSQVEQMAHILDPPQIKRADLASDPSPSLNRSWFREHAVEFRGRWVGLKNGELLHVAQSFEEIRAKISDTSGVLITRVP